MMLGGASMTHGQGPPPVNQGNIGNFILCQKCMVSVLCCNLLVTFLCVSEFVGCFLCEAEGICCCVWEGVYVPVCISGLYVGMCVQLVLGHGCAFIFKLCLVKFKLGLVKIKI